MITCLLVSAFFAMLIVWTGPACDDARQRLQYRLDFPRARAKLLQPGPEPCGLCGRPHDLLGIPRATPQR